MTSKLNILVLISGYGSNLQALIDSVQDRTDTSINARICGVISSSHTAFGLTRAKDANIPTTIQDLQTYYDGIPQDDKVKRKEARKSFNRDLSKLAIEYSPDLIVCAGWMLILSPIFLNAMSKENISIINLHPALPGQFSGINAIERAWESGQRGEITKGGVMIHRVIKEVDEGQPIVVKELDLTEYKSLEEYEKRVHEIEHDAIIEGTKIALKELQLKLP